MKLIFQKFLLYPTAFICIVSINFFFIHMMPGDPLVHLLGEEGYYYLSTQKPAILERMKKEHHLDLPVYKRYPGYFKKILQCDLGWSNHYGTQVFHVIKFRLKRTLMLLFPAVAVSTLLGGFLGALAGWKTRGMLDKFLTPGFLFLYSIPGYCLGLMLLIFAFHLDIFTGTNSTGSAAIWPMITVILHSTAYKYMIMRNSLHQELHETYVVTAFSRGLTDRQVLFRHVLKNALPPYIAVVALNLGFMVGGTLLVEIVFSWQGMGTLIYEAVFSRDYPLLSGCFIILSLCVIFANAMAELIHAYLDPRVRKGGTLV
ncbi:ABC transporter permease [Desulfobacula sp.]|uniref:ABC transporter permease n=1 Tax=Desulfobacula sp. TaxID=2593537 RepID=UPI0025B9AB8C|nr:ABC transporter permease [Desulfobacula sp.]MBC2705746.1 ABC transporter permease [Desulfobacula sp.]